MTRSEDYPELQLRCKAHDLVRARLEELPIEFLKRIEVGSGVPGEGTFTEVNNMGA